MHDEMRFRAGLTIRAYYRKYLREMSLAHEAEVNGDWNDSWRRWHFAREKRFAAEDIMWVIDAHPNS